MQQDKLERHSLDDLEAIYPQLRDQVAAGVREARQGMLSDGEAFFDELEREDRKDATSN
jgi:hypothetical protein